MRNKTLIILILLCSMFLIISGCGKKDNKNGKNEDLTPNSTIVSGQVIDGLKISPLSIVYENDISRIVANVTNTNDKEYILRTINIKLFDEKGQLLVETHGYIGTQIKPNETKQLIIDVTKDLRGAKTVEYKIEK